MGGTRFSIRLDLPLLICVSLLLLSVFMSSSAAAAAGNRGGKLSNYPGIADPNGIAVGPDGDLWFTNLRNNSIGRITTCGVNNELHRQGHRPPQGNHGRPGRRSVVHQFGQ